MQYSFQFDGFVLQNLKGKLFIPFIRISEDRGGQKKRDKVIELPSSSGLSQLQRHSRVE